MKTNAEIKRNMNGQTDRSTNRCDGQIDGYMDREIDILLYKWMDGWIERKES